MRPSRLEKWYAWDTCLHIPGRLPVCILAQNRPITVVTGSKAHVIFCNLIIYFVGSNPTLGPCVALGLAIGEPPPPRKKSCEICINKILKPGRWRRWPSLTTLLDYSTGWAKSLVYPEPSAVTHVGVYCETSFFPHQCWPYITQSLACDRPFTIPHISYPELLVITGTTRRT
jgi:hypothetical protein